MTRPRQRIGDTVLGADNAPDRDALPVVGQTLVGFDDVAVPLPGSWSIDDYGCGLPQSNTVAIPPLGPYEACASGRAPGVSDIQLDELGSPLGRAWSDVATDEVTLADDTSALIGTAPDRTLVGTTEVPPPGYSTTVLVIRELDAILGRLQPQSRPDRGPAARGRADARRRGGRAGPAGRAAGRGDGGPGRGLTPRGGHRVPFLAKGVVVDITPQAGLVMPPAPRSGSASAARWRKPLTSQLAAAALQRRGRVAAAGQPR